MIYYNIKLHMTELKIKDSLENDHRMYRYYAS